VPLYNSIDVSATVQETLPWLQLVQNSITFHTELTVNILPAETCQKCCQQITQVMPFWSEVRHQ